MGKQRVVGAVRPTAQELKEIIKGKQAEQIQRQEKYREAILTRLSKQARLNDFGKILKEKIDSKHDGPFEMWGSTFSSVEHAISEFNLESFYYEKAVSNEKYFHTALKNDGLTDEQIHSIAVDGKYVKFIDKNQKEKAQSYIG